MISGVRRLLLGFVLLCGLPAAVSAEAPDWVLEPGGRVGFIAKQAGAPVEGLFPGYTAEIRFSPEALEQSFVRIVIDVASVDSQSQERDDAIRDAGLFDVATWPEAAFEADGFVAKGGADYEAQGRLTLRDVTREVSLPFTLTIAQDPQDAGRLRAEATGRLEVLRLDYGVGQGLWKDTSVVANEVEIFFEILASRAAGE